MNFKLILLCLFGTVFSIQAQNSVKPTLLENSGSISGKIVDKKSNEPLPYVNIVVKEENKVVTGGITSDKGTFLIKNLALKNYTVEIQFIGYKTVTKAISLTNGDKNVNLNTIPLEEDAIQLKGVEVVSEKSTIVQKIDRKIINVGKDLISAGSTAGEIMNNIPSVSVDPQTNAISLRGNSNVRILIDGKPTNMDAAQILQQIPSASIKQIELITNPSAKYNPEGMSGIINIVLNKNSKLGFNGSINNGVTFGKTPKVNSSLDLNYRSGKFNFYGNYGFNHGKYSNHGFINSEETNKESLLKFDMNSKRTSHLAKLGFDFYINEKNTFSFYTNQNISRDHNFGSTDLNYANDTNGDQFQPFDSKSKDLSQTYNFDYKLDFKKTGHNLELEVNYNKNDSPEDALYTDLNRNDGTFIRSRSNQIETLGKNTIINLDYINPLTETTKLELGLESRNENTANSFFLNNAYNSNFTYERTIYSAYANLGKQWKKWSFQAGARLEQYNAEALFKEVGQADGKFKDDILSIYPSTFLTYNPSDKNSFNLNFSRRVDRPSLSQVNPIREFSTPTLDSKGNPDLVPQFTNSYELNYTRKTKIGSITSGVFYRRIEDEITRVLFTNGDKKILSYDNFENNNAYGFEISGNLDFKKWWSANISLDAYKKKVKGTIEVTPGNFEFVSVDATSFNARISNTFKATKDLRFQLSAMYRGRDLSLQFQRNAMWKMDLGTSYNILKGSGTISARFSDVFNTMHFAFDGDKPYKSNGQFNWESQSAYIGFNYRFGAGKNKAIQRKQRDKNETQGGGGLL
ncbi:TonB-dependent receptor domain-containing protein [Flavobacterium sp. ZT3R17]|uniref:TonB-dependent receptor domain-containing protein n=1 Tax=Flavobacterium cryoconiti TaxID=3398736 RepID=UPI003A87AA9F